MGGYTQYTLYPVWSMYRSTRGRFRDVDVSSSNPIPVSITSGAVEGGVSEVDLLRELITVVKFQTEQQIKTNNLLKLLLS